MRLLQCIRKNLADRTLRQYFLLLASNIVLVLAGFGSSYVLTKYMPVSEYGMYKFTLNAVSTISLFSLFGIPYSASLAIVRAKGNDDRSKIAGTALSLVIALYVIISIFLMIVCIFLSVANMEIERGIYFAILMTIALSLQSCFTIMYQGSNDIATISAQTIIPAVMMFIIFGMIGFLKKNISFNTAVTVYIAVFVAVHLFTIYRKKIRLSLKDRDNIKSMLELVKEKGLNVYYGSLIGVGSSYILNIILGFLVSMENYATYGLALSMSSPIQQIPAVMGVVLFKSSANTNRISKTNITKTIIITIFLYITYCCALRFAFAYIFPKEYAQSMTYVFFLAFSYALYGLGDYFNKFILAHGYSQYIRTSAVISGITNIVISSIGILLLRETGLVIGRIISGAAYLGVMLFFYRKTTAI